MGAGIASFLLGLGILLYLHLTKDDSNITIVRNEPKPPIKRIEEVEIKYRYKEDNPSKSVSGESLDFEEVK